MDYVFYFIFTIIHIYKYHIYNKNFIIVYEGRILYMFPIDLLSFWYNF